MSSRRKLRNRPNGDRRTAGAAALPDKVPHPMQIGRRICRESRFRSLAQTDHKQSLGDPASISSSAETKSPTCSKHRDFGKLFESPKMGYQPTVELRQYGAGPGESLALAFSLNSSSHFAHLTFLPISFPSASCEDLHDGHVVTIVYMLRQHLSFAAPTKIRQHPSAAKRSVPRSRYLQRGIGTGPD